MTMIYTSGKQLSPLLKLTFKSTGALRFSSSSSASTMEVVETTNSSQTATSRSNEGLNLLEDSTTRNINNTCSCETTPSASLHSIKSTLDFASFKPSKRNYINSLPRVPSTENIDKNSLLLDMLFNNYGPLSQPIKQNHTRSPATITLCSSKKMRKSRKKSQTTIPENIVKYKKIKAENSIDNYNVYFSKVKKFTPINSIFTNSVLNTQQHNLELFNLPLKYVENLKPYEVSNKPGDESFRDDLIYIRKFEIDAKKLKTKAGMKLKYENELKLAKKGMKPLEIKDYEEFFGFK